MAHYTVEIRTLVQNHFDLDLRDYPLFEEAHRLALNTKIINHFFFREIGFETAELFKVCLNRRMAEIMPYYNELYRSQTFEFEPLEDFREVETLDRDTSEIIAAYSASISGSSQKGASAGAGKSAGTHSDHSYNIYSDTPQGYVVGMDEGTAAYATNTNYDNGGGDNSTPTKSHTATVTETGGSSQGSTASDREHAEDYTRETKGKARGGKTYAELIEQWRSLILNIDMMIINELEDLFMSIW